MGKVSVVTVARSHLHATISSLECNIDNTNSEVSSLSRSCIKAAKKMLRLFEDLQSNSKITRFSFTDFQGCSIATIILLVASIIPEERKCQVTAAAGLEYLRMMAYRNTTATKGVHFVEAVQAIAQEAIAKLSTSKVDELESTAAISESTVSQYDQWAKWLATTTRSSASSLPPADLNLEATQPQRHEQVSAPPTPPSPHGHRLPPPGHAVAQQQHQQQITVLNEMSNQAMPQDLHDWIPSRGQLPGMSFESVFDDHDYLMGLTGLGVLDFGEQSDLGLDFG